MLWKDLTNKKVGIWGYGREGKSAHRAIMHFAQPKDIVLIDEYNLSMLHECDIVVKSPGVSLYRKEIIEAQRNSTVFTSCSELYMSNKSLNTFVVSVTGTKGKSTTSSLIYYLLKTAGKDVALGGNIGVCLLDLLMQEEHDFVVAELSSYQCADFIGSCDIAIMTNLFPEHLQWHGSHNQYYMDKCHMICQAKQSYINGSCEQIQKMKHFMPKAFFFNTPETFHLNNGWFCRGETQLIKRDYLNLIGCHNAENACAVLSVAHQLGIDLSCVQQAFSGFQSLPHRLQNIGCFNGLTFVDDSISTTPETAVAAIHAFDKGQTITLIVGGLDRGQNFDSLITALQPIKQRVHLIALPETGIKIHEIACMNGFNSYLVQTMSDAVRKAYQVTPIDGLVLLSPASPSYNLYKNFEERGLDFQKQVLLHK